MTVRHYPGCPLCHGTGEVREYEPDTGWHIDPCPAMEQDEIYERDWREQHDRKAERV